ncbi:MAG TPA: hypothetical protein VMU54_12250 [Planctomycetota bacterium]|nr:hypothetical protein [Planctomycetota bacterium]
MGTRNLYERGMAEVVDRLTKAGYDDVFHGETGGIRGGRSGLLHAPEDLEIRQIERFEGISNPEDETIVLALVCKAHGCRGTYVAPYGKDMSSTDASLISRIPDARTR